MASKSEKAALPVKSELHAAIPTLAATNARDNRIASTARNNLHKLLTDGDIRELADNDEDLSSRLGQVSAAIAQVELVTKAWDVNLAAASMTWDASLARIAEVSGEGMSSP